MHDELLDAGCTPECQAEYEALPDDEARLCYLKRHRRHLVETCTSSRKNFPASIILFLHSNSIRKDGRSYDTR